MEQIGVLADYLRARRRQLHPGEVGLPADSGRRLKGLRRAEVAALADISTQYYTRLEQGRTRQPSEKVLAGLVRALALDEHATRYLYRLALPGPSPATSTPDPVSAALVDFVGRWSTLPVIVTDRNQDVLIANELGLALFPSLGMPGHNAIEAVFAVPREGRRLEAWRSTAVQAVAALRFNSDPADPRLQQIVGGLSLRDPDFRRMWASHHARPLESGVVPVFVEGLGHGEVPWQVLQTPGGHTVVVYLAVADTFSGEAIALLRRRHPPVLAEPRAGRDIPDDAGAIDRYLEQAHAGAARQVPDSAPG
jgi:transcriptional regulator with XRE-family HTH domain